MISTAAIRGFTVVCLMKLCQKIVETQFVAMDPAVFHRLDGKAEDSVHRGRNHTCSIDLSTRTNSTQSSVTTWIYTTRYMLPVLGALLSSAWLGYIRVLQIGGVVMLLATVLMSMSVYLGLMCESSAIIPITWLLLPLFFGLTQPNIVHGMFQWHKQKKHSTVVSAIYYFNAVIGEWIALLMSPLSEASRIGSHAALLFIAFSGIFLALSFLLPSDSSQEQFEMPTRARMIRYFQIFSGLILFLFCVADTRPAMYTAEINFFLNGTGKSSFTDNSWLSAKWLNLITMMSSSLILMCIALLRSQSLPVQPRMQLGILLESAVATGLMIFTAIGTSNTTAVIAVYSAASVVDAVAEVLIMVAAYDLVQHMAPSNSKIFVYGIMFTVWGLANFASRIFVIAFGNQILPINNENPSFYAYHLISLVALITCSLYHRFLALPLALQVTPADSDHSEIGSELQPLLDHVET